MAQGPGSRSSGLLVRRAPQAAAAAVLLLTVTGAGRLNTPGPGKGSSARARYLMGTRLLIECREEVAPQVFEAAFEEVARLERILSNWLEDSELSRLNREGARAPFPVSPELLGAIEVSLAWAERTGGAFDPTVESLVRRYGLRGGDVLSGDGSRAGGDGVFPAEAGARPPAQIGWRHVAVDREAGAVRLTRAGIGIDLGGIGKGIALDEAARVLAARGVSAGLLDFGGQLLAVGEAGPEEGWLIGVADPAQRERVVATVNLRAGSLATSGNSERAVSGEQGTVGHILDPRHGAPARFTGSVSVLAADGTTADALSTALFVMGPEEGLEWAESRGVAALFIWRTAAGELEFLSSRAMRPDIDWAPVERGESGGT